MNRRQYLSTHPQAKNIGIFLLLLILAWSATHSWSEAFSRGVWFHLTEDEAFYAEVIENLRVRGFYGVWGGSAFSPSITGGPAFLLPPLVLAFFTGLNSAVAGRFSTFLFHLGTLLLIFSWALDIRKKQGLQNSNPSTQSRELGDYLIPTFGIPLLTLGLFFQVWRGIYETGYFLFGFLPEASVVFYFFLFLWAHQKNRPWLVGIAATLSLLAKPYMVFLPLSLGFFAIFKLAHPGGLNSKPASNHLPIGWKWILGLMLPALLWLSYMTYHLGLHGTVTYWLSYPKQVASFSGTASKLTPGAKFYFHLHHLKEIFNGRSILLTLLGLIALASTLRKKPENRVFSLFALTHLIWWFFINSSPVSRYLMPVGLVGLTFLLHWLIHLQAPQSWSAQSPPMNNPWIQKGAIAALFLVSLIRVAPDWKKNLGNYSECGFCRQVWVLNAWKALPPGPAPKKVWVATGEIAEDRDLLFTAPRDSRQIHTPVETAQIQKGDWVSVSDYTLPYFKTWVIGHCKKRMNPPGRDEGIWERY